MPLPPTYSASHHHIFQEAMTAVLPATIVSLPSYPSETTPLQSASHQLAFDYDPNSTAEQQCHLIYNDTTSTTVNTNPHHHPTDNCFEYFFRTTIFLSVWIPNSFHSTIAIYFQHGVPIHFHHGATIVYNSKKPQQIHCKHIISNEPISNKQRFIFFPLPYYRVSLQLSTLEIAVGVLIPCSVYLKVENIIFYNCQLSTANVAGGDLTPCTALFLNISPTVICECSWWHLCHNAVPGSQLFLNCHL